MSYKQNLHTHSVFCDGRDTPEEIVLTAIEKGFDSIGFSGHSYMYYSPGKLTVEKTESYRENVNALKKKYAPQIQIFCGLEVDMYSEVDLTGYDYLIGSVHYLLIGDQFASFDRSQKEVQNVIDTYFGGDGMAYAKAYYETLAMLPQYGDFDILGHIDLITKHSEYKRYFDEESKEYRSYAVEAAEALAGKIPLFEVNTGAIARGYRTTPYPSAFLLEELRRLGFGAVITSDCHDRRMLDCGFDDARQLLEHCGFREIYILTEKGFVPILI